MTGDEQKLACEIGLTLRRLRHARGLTQKGLAQRVSGGVDATYIGKIERGDQLPSLKVLLRLSRTLGITVSDFFYPPPDRAPDRTPPALHLEPLLQALHNRGIDGVALIRAVLDAIGQHVLVAPPRRATSAEPEPVPRADSRTAIPLPMPQASGAKAP
jgi:transcriptional regulator with XRE-family HTH domain